MKISRAILLLLSLSALQGCGVPAPFPTHQDLNYSRSLPAVRAAPLGDLGNAEAQYQLGVMYYFGKGVPADYAQSAKWYRLAAEQGHVVAQYKLADMYHAGLGVRQDDTEAAKWYRLADQQGMTRDDAYGRAPDSRVCDMATENGAWEQQRSLQNWVDEARARGLTLEACSQAHLENNASSSIAPKNPRFNAEPDCAKHSNHFKVQCTGEYGSSVLAAAPGVVAWLETNTPACGNGVVINHPKGLYTVYCELHDIRVARFQKVERGEVIGRIGNARLIDGTPLIFFRVNVDGSSRYPDSQTELVRSKKPMEMIVGCFIPNNSYPDDESAHTKPVAC